MFAGETSYDKSSENQSDTVCRDNVFVYGGRMIPQDWLYPFDFSAFIQSEVSPRQSQNLQKNWSKGWTLSTTFPISTSFYNFQFCCWNDCRFR